MRERGITAELLTEAQEIHRRRVIAGQGVVPHFSATVSELALVESYGRDFSLNDLKVAARSLQVVIEDNQGTRLRVINRNLWPMRVYARRLDVDAFVFARTDLPNNLVTFYGWATIEQVEEAPVWWWEENGERTDYAHEIERAFMTDMPTEFVFKESCEHSKWGHIWDWANDAWECCGCGGFLHHAAGRAWNEKHEFSEEAIARRQARRSGNQNAEE